MVHNTNKEKCDHCGLVVKTIKKLQAPVVKVHTKDIPFIVNFVIECLLISRKQIFTRVVCTTLKNAMILNVQKVPKQGKP